MDKEDISFSKQMRIVTRDVHKISDSLINAKLAFAMSDNKVWAEGLLIFYEIFKYLEENVSESLLPKEFHRTNAFEVDLAYYLGNDWKNLTTPPRHSVQQYLNHLKQLQQTESIVLIAYVYHLYMGLLSGGQILQHKRQFTNKLKNFSFQKSEPFDNELVDGPSVAGNSVTNFGRQKISDLKKRMRTLVDELGPTLNADIQQQILQESRQVFHWNDTIVRSIKSVNRVIVEKVVMIVVGIVVIYFGIKFYKKIF